MKRFTAAEVEGKGFIHIVDAVNAFNGVPSACTFSVTLCTIVLVVSDCREYFRIAVAGFCQRIVRLWHFNPSGLHFSIDKCIIVSVNFSVVLSLDHFSVFCKVVPALLRIRSGGIFFHPDPAGLHGTVMFFSEIVPGTVDVYFAGKHVTGFIEIVPFFILLEPVGSDGFSVLIKVIPERSRGFRRIKIFFVGQFHPGISYHFTLSVHIKLIDLLIFGNMAVLIQVDPVSSFFSPGVGQKFTVFIVKYHGTVFFCPAALGSVYCLGLSDERWKHRHKCSRRQDREHLCLFFHNRLSFLCDAPGICASGFCLRADYNGMVHTKSIEG